VDKQERVWVCDRENGRIQIFSPKGELLSLWVDVGGKPTGLFFGSGDTVYVSVKSGELPHGVSIFTLDGELLARWGSTEARTTMFWSPHAVVVDSRGDIYVGEIRHEMAKADSGSRALQKFTRVL
jgi:DNA-binding beta-propeller fold protein YncE